MEKAKVLFVSQEINPYLGNDSLANMGRTLPQRTQERGKEVRIFMPRFNNINERKHQLHEVIRLSGINIIINDVDHPLIIKVASLPNVRMQIYFIDNEDFFNTTGDVVRTDGTFNEKNDERCMFFARGVLETAKKLSWKTDIIHCNGWFSMLVPYYVRKTEYRNNPYFASSKVVVSLCNDEFGETLCSDFTKKLKQDGGTLKDYRIYKEPTYLNIMKGAIANADAVVCASDSVNEELVAYAKELKKPVVEYNADAEALQQAINDMYDTLLAPAGK